MEQIEVKPSKRPSGGGGGQPITDYMKKAMIGVTDFNTLVDAGSYRYDKGNPNKPTYVSDYGQLLTVRGAGDTIAQLAFSYDKSHQFALRVGNPPDVGGTGTWTPWSYYESLTSGNVMRKFAFSEINATILKNPNYKVAYCCDWSNISELGITDSSHTWGFVEYIPHGNSNGYGMQRCTVFVSGNVWVRCAEGLNWNKWTCLIDNTLKPLPLVNGWTNYGGNYSVAQYYLSGGEVVLTGFVKNGSSNIIANLPAGFRPNGIKVFNATKDGSPWRVDVDTNGNVYSFNTTGFAGLFSLEGIRFKI